MLWRHPVPFYREGRGTPSACGDDGAITASSQARTLETRSGRSARRWTTGCGLCFQKDGIACSNPHWVVPVTPTAIKASLMAPRNRFEPRLTAHSQDTFYEPRFTASAKGPFGLTANREQKWYGSPENVVSNFFSQHSLMFLRPEVDSKPVRASYAKPGSCSINCKQAKCVTYRGGVWK
jgi:hypothetical protein